MTKLNEHFDTIKLCNTHLEIHAQPTVWREWASEIEVIAADIKDWVRHRDHQEVWFCGAGTSAFIGDTLASHFGFDGGCIYRAISTTDFVSTPQNFPKPQRNLLIVSFGRSGDSSETIAMLNILDLHFSDVDRLNITCNIDSHLANCKLDGVGQQKVIILPSNTLDKGFAMTSSYTTMLLSALACFDHKQNLSINDIFFQLAENTVNNLQNISKWLMSSFPVAPKRCIFLGSGALLGTARESSLKILELTAGKTTTQWDSSLGFRHGPKAVVDADTKIFILISNDPHTQKYDLDIAEEIKAQYGADKVITIGVNAKNVDIQLGDSKMDATLAMSDVWTSVLYVLVAQLLSVQWSIQLGLNVDDPFVGQGNLTRVVSGVTIYPY